jgi:hypothetical protein
MHEWPSYQLAWEIGFRKGQLKEARKILRMWGDKELGPPGARIADVIERVTDLKQLEDLALRVWTAPSWPALLGRLLPASRATALTLRPKVRAGRRGALLSRLRTPLRPRP